MSDTRSFHLEPFQRPVSSRNRANETRGDVVTLKLHGIECVKLIRPRGLFQDLVDSGFEIRIEGLK